MRDISNEVVLLIHINGNQRCRDGLEFECILAGNSEAGALVDLPGFFFVADAEDVRGGAGPEADTGSILFQKRPCFLSTIELSKALKNKAASMRLLVDLPMGSWRDCKSHTIR